MGKKLSIYIVSSWSPRKCGIATFSNDLIKSLKKYQPTLSVKVLALEEMVSSATLHYGKSVIGKIKKGNIADLEKAASTANKSQCDLVLIQHEFGLFGGKDGSDVLELMRRIKKPIVTFLHTIPLDIGSKRRKSRLKILARIADMSKIIIVTSQLAKDGLASYGDFNPKKIYVIRHGTPGFFQTSLKKREAMKKKIGLQGKKVIFTFGLIRKNKGLEYGIRAMKKISERFPEAVYLIAGMAHPGRKKNLEYYLFLQNIVQQKKLDKNVFFINNFLTEKKIKMYLEISDIALFPYLTKEQVSSGSLAWSMAAGAVSVSTPFHYAREILSQKRGLFINYRDQLSIEKAILFLLSNPLMAKRISQKSYRYGTKNTWTKNASKCLKLFHSLVGKK